MNKLLMKTLKKYRYPQFADPANPRTNVRGYIAGDLPAGLVTVNGVPSSRRVLLFHRDSKFLIGRMMSSSAGIYRFDDLPVDEEYDLWADDYARAWGDVIAYAVKPKPY